jgi:glycosyltransferase involved in cell wall biosynthesis
MVVPLYLPLVLDGQLDLPARDSVQMGGINMYLLQRMPWLRHLPKVLAGQLDRPGLLRWASRRGNMTDSPDLGPLTVETLRGEAGRQASEVKKLIQRLSKSARPDVVVLSNAMLIGLASSLKGGLDGVRVVCTLQGEEPFLDRLPEPYREQAWTELRSRVAGVDAFIGVSRWYGSRMASRLSVDPERLHVVPNGIEVDDLAALPAPSPAVPTIGFLARLCADKGLEPLVEAFEQLHARGTLPGLRLHLCGAVLNEDRRPLAALRARVKRAGLEDQVDILTNVTRAQKVEFLSGLSVLSVPATYGESFGLYVLEALAAGVPVVQPDHGGLSELVTHTRGGVLYDPSDPEALADALESFLLDSEGRKAAAEHGRAAVLSHYTAKRMSADVAQVCASTLE